jgi:hypothetical protein
MKNVITRKLLLVTACLIYCNLYGAKIPTTEMGTVPEPLATKTECAQWEKNIKSNETIVQKLDAKLKNVIDQKSRNDLQTKIKMYQHKLLPLEDNYNKECKKGAQ